MARKKQWTQSRTVQASSKARSVGRKNSFIAESNRIAKIAILPVLCRIIIKVVIRIRHERERHFVDVRGGRVLRPNNSTKMKLNRNVRINSHHSSSLETIRADQQTGVLIFWLRRDMGLENIRQNRLQEIDHSGGVIGNIAAIDVDKPNHSKLHRRNKGEGRAKSGEQSTWDENE